MSIVMMLVMSAVGPLLWKMMRLVSAAIAANMLMRWVEVVAVAVRQTARSGIICGAVVAAEQIKVLIKFRALCVVLPRAYLHAPERYPSDLELGGGRKHIPGKSVS